MDAEYYRIEDAATRIVNKAKEDSRRICSFGTTTMRSLESSVTAQGFLKPSEGWTNIFIHPPYNFSIADSLVTNFICQNQPADHDLCLCRLRADDGSL
jgi:S-adenosylmethionine:tRNA ribosyltransferase-isomerase